MNIKQALKLKNKLTAQIAELYRLAKTYNSIEEGNPRRYSIVQLLNQANALTNELVDLKTQIHLANGPVYGKIFRLAELKGRAKQIAGIGCEEGKVTERYGSTVSIKEAEMNVIERDNLLRQLETEIEQLQDELDIHNATTTI